MSLAISRISEKLGPCSVAIQDGKDAGQTVSHVHFHIVPRPKYGVLSVDANSPDRNEEEMKNEAQYLKSIIDYTLSS